MKTLALCALCTLSAAMSQAFAADDPDPLALESAPEAKPEAAAGSPYRLVLEAAAGRIKRNDGLGSTDTRRGSLDFRYAASVGSGWRVGLSDRLDDLHPTLPGAGSTVNSVREAYVGWQTEDGTSTADLGRLNYRNGPAFGYNPTDYFRSGALRVVTTADPVTLRETRMGAFMLKGSQQWGDTSLTVVLAPKLASTPDNDAFAGDWGSTNRSDRALVVAGSRVSERVSGQLLLLGERGAGARVGASGTALVSDSVVTYAEVSYGRASTVLGQVLQTGEQRRYGQASVGLTYSTPIKLSLTVEANYNGGGLRESEWRSVLVQGGAPAALRYLDLTQRSQELGFRQAWLVYVTQKELGLKQLDFTGFVRINGQDHSRLAWGELRYHWPKFDLALQVQHSTGDALTEYERLPYRRIVQLLGSLYF